MGVAAFHLWSSWLAEVITVEPPRDDASKQRHPGSGLCLLCGRGLWKHLSNLCYMVLRAGCILRHDRRSPS